MEKGSTKKSFSKKELNEAVRRLTNGNSGQLLKVPTSTSGFDAAAEGAVSRPGRARSSVLDVVEWGVNMNARKFNELRTLADRKASALKSKLEILRTLKIEQASLQNLCAEHSSEAVRIRELLKAIDFVQDDIDQRQHERRQLEHMLKRLEQNQLSINQHVQVLDDGLNDSKREHKEMRSMLRQIEAGHTKASLDKKEVERLASIESNERKRALEKREIESRQAATMEQWRQRRELARKDFASELRGDLSKADELRLQQTLRTQKKTLLELRVKHEHLQKQAAVLEANFVAVRQATGVNSLDEVVDKFQSQEGNRQSLANEKKDAEERLTKAKSNKEQLETKFAELKASGIGSTEMSREIANQLESEIYNCRIELKTSNASCERLESVLVALRQGAVGLYQRLRPFAYLLEGEGALPAAALSNLDHTAHTSMTSSEPVAIDSIDAIHLTELLLSKMVEIIGGGAASGTTADNTEAVVTTNKLHQDSTTNDEEDQATNADWRLPSPKNNIRIMSINQRQSAEIIQGMTTDENITHIGTNDIMLGQSSQQASIGDSPENANNDLMTSGNSGNSEQAGSSICDNNDAAEDVVPSRSFLKLSSSRQHHEMLRRIEHDSRKKRNIMEMADLSQSDRRQISTRAARKKAQNEANDRLSTQPSFYQPPFSRTKESAVDRSLELLSQTPKLK